jgi:hypothetical protein
MRLYRFALYAAFTAALLSTALAASPQPDSSAMTQVPDSRLIFQTGKAWSPRTNINADTVMVYGIDDTTADRIRSWRSMATTSPS